MRNGVSMRGICNDDEKEFEIIRNKKNFTVAVRIKPEFNATSSNLINIEVKGISP